MKADIAEMKAELVQIKELLSADRGEVVKEAYTVEEVAEKTKYQPVHDSPGVQQRPDQGGVQRQRPCLANPARLTS